MARVRRSFVRGARRKTAWSLGPASGATRGSTQSVVASSNIIMIVGVTPSVEGLTHVRLRGELLMGLVLATASGDGFFGAFGVGIIPGGERGFSGVGVSALPIPVTNSDDETWIYHRFFAITAGFPFATGADPGGNRTADLRIEIDSKAMRKLSVGDITYAALEVNELGTAGMDINFNSRSLVKLS